MRVLHKTLQSSFDGVETRSRKLRKTAKFILFLPLYGWGFMALWYGSWNPLICHSLAILYLLVHPAALILSKRRPALISSALFLMPLLCFLVFMRPSNDRIWHRDVEKTPWAERFGDQVTLHNVRNCKYQSVSNYVVNYETRIYDLNKLESVDVSLTDWGLGTVAHTMVSFGFGNGTNLCVSIEARKERGEDYSSFLGFFRQFELIYIAADERDLIGLRTCYRAGETVRLYRIVNLTKSNMRDIFLEYIRNFNELKDKPQWYNAITKNCMTSLIRIVRHTPEGRARSRWSWQSIANGYADEKGYRNGALDQTLPFKELKERSIINEKAKMAGNAPDFSLKIREGLPGYL